MQWKQTSDNVSVVCFFERIKNTKLLIRPSIIEDESVEGFIVRLSQLNDYSDDFIEMCLREANVKTKHFKIYNKNSPRVIQLLKTTLEKKEHSFITVCPKCKKSLIRNETLSEKQTDTYRELWGNCNIFYFDQVTKGIKILADEANLNEVWTFYEPNLGKVSL